MFLSKDFFRIVCTLSFLVTTYILIESQSSFVEVSANDSSQIPDFNFVAAGDWGM